MVSLFHKKSSYDSSSSKNEQVDEDKSMSEKDSITRTESHIVHQKWQNPEYFDSTWKEYLFLVACFNSQLLNQSGALQTQPLMNIIADSLGSKNGKQAWLMAAFPLVSGSFILISGRIGDIYGLKSTLLVGYVILIIWSLICGLSNYAHNDAFFIVSRAFQGLGISLILPNLLGIVGSIYIAGTRRKNMVISLIGCMAPIGATLGGVFAGLIGTEDKNQWPWAFYSYAIYAALNSALCLWLIPNNIPTNVHKHQMDWIGSFLGVAGLILLNFVWNQAPIDGWDSAYLIVLLVISVVLLVAFFIFELKFVKVSPLLPKEVIKSPKTLLVLCALFFGWGSFGIFSFYYFAFQLNLRGYTPLWAGGTYFMFLIWGIVAALVVGFTIKKVYPSIILFASMVAFNVGSIIVSVTPVHQTYFRNHLGMMIILSFGMDLSFPASSILLSDKLPLPYQGMAGSLVNTMVNYSMSFCLGVAGVVEQHVNHHGMDILKGYRGAFYLGIGLASIACIISGGVMLNEIILGRKRTTHDNIKDDNEMSS
ncbi:Aminotriazole resistance protein [Nakaseomyces bracarensis]|uniref:Aminotriazole resistance protein n=1 Tax=Nakaseomyces bracarensis TaxID=273131 RepID=A0ABR4NXR5_9SACH